MSDETTSVFSDIWAKAKAAFAAVKDWPKSVSFIAGFVAALVLKAMV
jgi:hypothetical protein